ncbi:MAG: Gfo/Idh/MocA family oxidoreductase [Clostridia bacterium]|nr:Gfo/Idh/MocA family oxidoreductase [Clostridia bacterium]
MSEHPVTAVIVGCGHRAVIYADYALEHPEELKIVGVADPNRERCLMAAKRYGFSVDRCYDSAEALARVPRFADAVINGTMDHQHVETSIPLLHLGYDILLEKPFAVNASEMRELDLAVKKTGRRVMICHVLRYARFYQEIKRRIVAGEIGDIINIQQAEHVSFHHLSTSYVRGKWANSEKCRTTMLLAKSCHDLDIMMWMMNPVRPKKVSSVGSRMMFRPENAPEGAGTRCTRDCPLVDVCLYSSKRLYLEHPDKWIVYVWADLEHLEHPTDEDRIDSFRNGNPYDRCIFKCDNNVVDHQSVLIEFEGGATGTFNMVGGSAQSMRTIHVIGTKGEIWGEFESGDLHISCCDPDEPELYRHEKVDLSEGGGHGGGDEAIVEDFIRYVRTGEQSLSCTAIENSIAGHLTVFLADDSREHGGEIKECHFEKF